MSGALINLVRLYLASVTDPDHDYTAGEIFERHEEIQLVDPDGQPCAIPEPATFENIDYKFNLITGARQHSALAIRRSIGIGVDYLDNEVCRRLEHWMQQRALVLITPNMGRNTIFSFRPVHMNQFDFGTVANPLDTAIDLTGNHELVFWGQEDMLSWDRVERRFAKTGYVGLGDTDLPIHTTPGGGGFGFPLGARNLMKPAYPESATEGSGTGKCGWYKSGADAATLVFTHHSGLFGHPSCPDVLRVAYNDTVTAARSIAVSTMWDPGDGDYQGITPSGALNFSICIWMRGQLPDSSVLTLTGNTGTTTRDLSGLRLNGWTPIIISRKETNWAASVPVLRLTLQSADGIAGAVEIGPTMAANEVALSCPPGEYWAPTQSYGSKGEILTVNAFAFPDQGTIIASFWVPEWWGEVAALNSVLGVLGNDDWSLRIGSLAPSIDMVTIEESGAGSTTFYPTGYTIKPGEINTLAFAWSGERQRLYLNGDSVGDVNRSSADITFGGNDSALRVGFDHAGNSMYPAILLSARIDEGAMTDDDVKNIHLALTDPIALQTAAVARGRVFQITGVPQTLRSSQDGSQVLGVVQLEQVDHQNWLADPLNKEESVL